MSNNANSIETVHNEHEHLLQPLTSPEQRIQNDAEALRKLQEVTLPAKEREIQALQEQLSHTEEELVAKAALLEARDQQVASMATELLEMRLQNSLLADDHMTLSQSVYALLDKHQTFLNEYTMLQSVHTQLRHGHDYHDVIVDEGISTSGEISTPLHEQEFLRMHEEVCIERDRLRDELENLSKGIQIHIQAAFLIATANEAQAQRLFKEFHANKHHLTEVTQRLLGTTPALPESASNSEYTPAQYGVEWEKQARAAIRQRAYRRAEEAIEQVQDKTVQIQLYAALDKRRASRRRKTE